MISVIVTTAPGREDYLKNCLALLAQHTFKPFEVIVSDDGSSQAQAVVAAFQDRLALRYLWRPNDMCVSRSRNRAAQCAQGELLVFIDGDMLLNPLALHAYWQTYLSYPEHMVMGYFGNQTDYAAPSRLWPDCFVNYVDKRVLDFHRKALLVDPVLSQTPYFFAWSGNVGIPKALFEAVGGFDERYWGWGFEDVQMGLDLNQAGYGFIYSFEVWAEHQDHSRSEGYHRQRSSGKLYTVPGQDPKQKLILMPDTVAAQQLRTHLFEHYFPHDIGSDPLIAACLTYPDYHYSPGGALQ